MFTQKNNRLLFSAFVALSLGFTACEKPTEDNNPNPSEPQSPQFTPQGELWLIKNNTTADTLATLEVEYAITQEEISTGLMNREELPANAGMLFIFSVQDSRSFWMKDTYLPLDVIFIDLNYNIVNIVENTVPLTTTPIRSTGDAKYVLEVNAGLSYSLGLKAGDTVKWRDL